MTDVVFSLKSLINKEVNVVLHVSDEVDPSSSLIIHYYESVKLFTLEMTRRYSNIAPYLKFH